MKEISVNADNLMSVIMGTGVSMTWRGQKGLVIRVPFAEWYSFVEKNCDLLVNRSPFNCKEMLQSGKKYNWYKIFLWDVIRAQYNELCISSNTGKDCTVIIPDCGDGSTAMNLVDCVTSYNSLSNDEVKEALSMIRALKPSAPMLVSPTLSAWNNNLFSYCIYLQHFALNSKGTATKVKIDWR